jgi:uncharacterized membrane protein YtjA (UPF0391 family)
MLRWAIIALTIALIAAALGYVRVARGAAAVGEFLLIVFVTSLIGALMIALTQWWASRRDDRQKNATHDPEESG